MKRLLTTALSLLALTAPPVLSQSHPGTHQGARQHGPGHPQMDSATHAALHALLHGSWTGTLTSPDGASGGMTLAAAQDSQRVTVTVSTDKSKQGNVASNLELAGSSQVSWTQQLGDASCNVSAVVTGASPTSPEAMIGSMTCNGIASTFTLRRKSA